MCIVILRATVFSAMPKHPKLQLNGGKMIRTTLRVGFFCILGFLLLPSLLRAQMAQVTGTVTDSTGAAVPDVIVTATGVDTGVARTTQTTGTGAYTIPDLVPANYNIIVIKPGFKIVQFNNVSLTIDQRLTIDVKLEVSAVQQTIEVSGEVIAPIDAEDAQISNVVNSTEMKALPLILRDPYQLILLSPGVIQSNTRLSGFSANGQREINNNFMIDGIDNNDTDVPGGGSGLNALNPDSTQEFRVITNNFNAEYGRDNGAIIDVKSPSGTNAYHGDVLWFGRYSALGARDYFNHFPDTEKDPYERNLFGGSVGGPIIHNKTFFFANYEGHRWSTTLTNSAIVPTQAFKTGIFTYTYVDQNNVTHNVPIDVSQPSNATNNNALPYGPDPTIAQIFSHYPNPNGGNVTSYSGLYFFPSPDNETDNNTTIRVDHQLSKNNSLFVRYLFDQGTASNSGHSDFLPGLGDTQVYYRTQNAGLGLTTVISPTLVNEVRIGGNRNDVSFACGGLNTFDGLGAQFIDQYGRGSDFGFADPVGGGFTSFGCGSLGDSNGQARFTGTYQVTDNVTWTRGSHSLKWGFEYRDAYSNGFSDFSSRQAFGFDPSGNGIQVLQNIPPADQAAVFGDRSLNDAVGVLLGAVTTQTQNQFFNAAQQRVSSDERGFRQHETGLFIQDTWKVKSNLTLTYGLRWEYFGVPYEVNGELSTLFDDPTRLATTPFTFSTLSQGGNQIYSDNYKGFDPRIGIAWDPFKTGRTSIRAGYGVFRDRVYGNLFENTDANPPFLQTAVPNLPADNSLQGVSAPATVPTTNVIPDFTFLGPTLFARNFKTPSSQNWNVGIQHQFGNDLTVEVNYVGVHGIHEFRAVDLNPPQPALVKALLAFCTPTNPLNTGFFNPFNPNNDPTVGAAGQCTQASVTSDNLWVGDFFGTLPDLGPAGSGPAVLNRAFASAANGYVSGGSLTESIAHSNYNGLQLNVTKRYSHGLQAQLAYTYSHSLDNGSDPINPASGNRTFPRNSLNLGPEYGNSDFDVRHRAVINFIYSPNVGRGKDHFNNGLMGRALEGWQIAGIVTLQTGLPYDIFGIRDTQHTGFSDRATLDDPGMLHVNPGGNVPSSQVFTGVNVGAFNPDTVTDGGLSGTTPFGVVSNVHRNQFFGPGIDTWNAVVSKDTVLTERLKMQLRFEFFNLFNHPEFGQPGNTLATPQVFGFSTSQVGQNDGTTGARQIQLAAKLIF
jgi:carboxypeptidase family protein/TonB-dependent receptor-like protein